jgi:hypothetical protein
MVHNLEVVDGLGGKLSAAASGVLVVIAYTVDADCIAAWPQSFETKASVRLGKRACRKRRIGWNGLWRESDKTDVVLFGMGSSSTRSRSMLTTDEVWELSKEG